jgi:hypothetical protein
MTDEERVIAAIMRAAGVTEVRVSDEDLVDRSDVVITYRDHMADRTVFRLRPMLDVIDGEEVPSPDLAIEAGA